MTAQLPTQTIYNQNYPLWLETTIRLLRDRQFEALDIDHLVEEIQETGLLLDTFPDQCPFSVEEVLNSDYSPD